MSKTKPTGRVTLPVFNLGGSQGRARLLQHRLERVGGVESAYVSLSTEMAYIVYDPEEIALEALRKRLEQLDTPSG
ncbi:MAG: heavy metal-associated domain-containing protein [Meiothermus sp.]|nr:heavy metal-associated domain-containing protein [Meiothermus sp.]